MAGGARSTFVDGLLDRIIHSWMRIESGYLWKKYGTNPSRFDIARQAQATA